MEIQINIKANGTSRDAYVFAFDEKTCIAA